AALVPFLLLLAILAAIGYVMESVVAPQLAEMLNNFQRVIQALLEHLLKQFNLQNQEVFGHKLDPQQLSALITDSLKQTAGANIPVALGATVGALMGGVLSVVLFAFLLFTGPQIARGAMWLVPPNLRPRVYGLVLEIDPMLSSYLRGIFVIVLFAGTATYLVTGLVFHLSHAIFLAVAVGLLELIPVIGPILSFAAFGLMAIQQTGIESIIGFGAFAIALRLAIDQLVGPLVLGRAARIPAIVVIFSFLVGGALFGILGVILAIPVAATVKIVLTDLYEGPPGPSPSGSTDD
ncbi:MAG TPA: AI-2E family transporter, partial [Tepidisphaeraceae bacterium]|nr:AI-2E family transporter [Tepidisphaeraceae bacterium]